MIADWTARFVACFDGVARLAAALDPLSATAAYVVALPIKIEDGSGGPLRIIAWVKGKS